MTDYEAPLRYIQFLLDYVLQIDSFGTKHAINRWAPNGRQPARAIRVGPAGRRC